MRILHFVFLKSFTIMRVTSLSISCLIPAVSHVTSFHVLFLCLPALRPFMCYFRTFPAVAYRHCPSCVFLKIAPCILSPHSSSRLLTGAVCRVLPVTAYRRCPSRIPLPVAAYQRCSGSGSLFRHHLLACGKQAADSNVTKLRFY